MNNINLDRFPFSTLVGKVLDWSYERNIINGSTSKDQFLKLVSELGELSRHVLNITNVSAELDKPRVSNKKDRLEELNGLINLIKDDIGDCLVVIINLIAQEKLNHKEIFDEVSRYPIYMKELAPIGYLDYEAISMPLSLISHIGILSDHISKKNTNLIKRKIVDVIVKLRKFSIVYTGSDLDISLQAAYDDIKDRKGIMYNGTFVKSTDGDYAKIFSEVFDNGRNNVAEKGEN